MLVTCDVSQSVLMWPYVVRAEALLLAQRFTAVTSAVLSANTYLSRQAVQGPPQSTPVSAWFCTPSEQVGQAVQVPPQSTPVSAWFCTPSEQVGQAPPVYVLIEAVGQAWPPWEGAVVIVMVSVQVQVLPHPGVHVQVVVV
jgi:hypothetical protein